MEDTTKKTWFARFMVLLPVVLAFVLAGPVIWYCFGRQTTNFADVGLGGETAAIQAKRDGDLINVVEGDKTDLCLAGYRKRGSRPGVLWLGNSQLHGVNQFQSGQLNAPERLWDLLNTAGMDTLTVSLPNASPEEQQVVFDYVKPRMNLKLVIVGVCFDDLRNEGIREDTAELQTRPAPKPRKPKAKPASKPKAKPAKEAEAVKAAEIAVAEGKVPAAEVVADKPRPKKVSSDKTAPEAIATVEKNADTPVKKPLRPTTQEITEQWLNDTLAENWGLWKAREEARGQIFLTLYKARNTALGIDAYTKRRMLRPSYERNFRALDAILTQARAAGIDVVMYVVPVSDEAEPPYVMSEYAEFKTELEKLVTSRGGQFANLESLVPAKYWGKKDSTKLGGEPEIDFMHFQEPGHKLLAEKLDAIIRREKLGGAGK